MKTTSVRKFELWAAMLFGCAFAASAVQVTFQVNMEIQTIIGTFNPTAHTVEIHGAFDGWGPGVMLSQSPTNTAVYAGTVDLTGAAGSEVQYKYVINQGAGALVWENDGVGPGGANNRAINVPASEQSLNAVYFNNVSTPPGVVAVTFRLNMEIQKLLGNFDGEIHTAEVRGSFDNWGTGLVLTNTAAAPNIYQGTANVTGSAGANFEYKYVINRSGTLEYEGNVGPGGPFGNRVFVLSPPSQTLPLVYFNNLTNIGAVAVTFQANMLVQAIRGAFDTGSGVVDVRGPFNNWGTPSGFVLTNSPANPYLFMGTLSVSNTSPGNNVAHKFTMNGSWEGGNDRTFVLASSSQTLPPRYFDDVGNLGPLAITPAPSGVELTVTWTGYPLVRLQSATTLTNAVWENVPNTQGASSATIFSADPDSRMFLRLIGP